MQTLNDFPMKTLTLVLVLIVSYLICFYFSKGKYSTYLKIVAIGIFVGIISSLLFSFIIYVGMIEVLGVWRGAYLDMVRAFGPSLLGGILFGVWGGCEVERHTKKCMASDRAVYPPEQLHRTVTYRYD